MEEINLIFGLYSISTQDITSVQCWNSFVTWEQHSAHRTSYNSLHHTDWSLYM